MPGFGGSEGGTLVSSQAYALESEIQEQKLEIANLKSDLSRANARIETLEDELRKANEEIGDLEEEIDMYEAGENW